MGPGITLVQECIRIKEKALILIRKTGRSNEEFTASEVWLNRWKK
jgi:hypothetical protein